MVALSATVSRFGESHEKVKKQLQVSARQLHLEPLQFLFELGFIGFMFICYLVKDFLNIHSEDRLQLVLKTLCVGYLLSCLFNFPVHLWLPTSLAIFAYSAFHVLKEAKDGIEP